MMSRKNACSTRLPLTLHHKGQFAVAGHCRCASTIRGQFPHCATPQNRENAGVRRPFAVCIVRAMLSCIDSDPLQQRPLCVSVRAGAPWSGPPARAGIGVLRSLCRPCVYRLLGGDADAAQRAVWLPVWATPSPRAVRAPIHAAAGGREAQPAGVLGCLPRAPHAEA